MNAKFLLRYELMAVEVCRYFDPILPSRSGKRSSVQQNPSNNQIGSGPNQSADPPEP